MTLTRRQLSVSAVPLVAFAVAAPLTGCGSSASASGDAATSTPTAANSGQTLNVSMDDFFFKPADLQAKAGSVTISADNTADQTHELVIAKTNADPAKLPTSADGSVDEAKLDSPGEVSETPPARPAHRPSIYSRAST